ncbi:MAG: hypothetical protein RXR18_03805 [Nitrososphaeria archaeon]
MSLNNSNNKKQQQQEPTYEIPGTTTTPTPTPLFPPIQQTQQQPQLSPLGRRNIVKVDPNLVRQAIREKAIIPTRQVTQKEAIEVTTIQEIINNYVLILTKDLKSGSLQFYGTPYNVDENFQILLSILTDRFSSLAVDELSEKFAELRSLISSDANYDDIIAKLDEAHKLVILLLLAFERSIMEVAGVSTSKMRVEMLSPLEIAQTLGITPISTDRL